MSPSPRGPRGHGLPLLSALSCHSKVAFPTELNAPCPFPAFPSYRENWHCGPCPLCQLAKSLEGRCSVSDITIRISPSFLRRALPYPLVARELACLCPRLPWPSCFTLTLEEVIQPPLFAGRNALPFPPRCLPLLLPFPPHLTHESFTNNCYSEAKRKQKIGKEEPSKCMVRFSRTNLLSCQGRFAWLLAPLVSSQVAQSDGFSLSPLDGPASQLSTLIFQF